MAEEIKYVEEAPESQPSVREKLAWVPGYPRDRLDEFLDNIALLVSQAREQASLAETRASQATLEAYNAAASRQAAASSALEGLGYKQAASKSAGDSATEADRSNEEADRAAGEADRAKQEADRSVQTIADHLAANDPHSVYLRKELPAGATVTDQFVFTTEGFRKLVAEGGIKITRYKQEELSQALGWNDPKLLIEGDYVLEVTDFLNGPELESGFTEYGGWWYLSTRMISSGYYVQNAYSDFGDICIRYASTDPETPPGKWVVFANSSAYCKTRQQVISGASEGYATEYQLTATDVTANHLVVDNVESGFGIRLPTNVGKVNGMETSVKFFITNNTSSAIDVIAWDPAHRLNGSNRSVSIPAFTTAILINLGSAWEWSIFGFGLGGGANAPVFLDKTTTAVKNYTKHRIMCVNGNESEGVAQLFLLPAEGEGWVDISVDHTWKTNARGELLTPLVLVAPDGETISTNDGEFAAVQILYRNDLTAFRYANQWRINDCVEYVMVGPATELTVSSIVWTTQTETSSLMQNLKQLPSYPNGEFWWIAWNDTHYQVSRTVNTDTHELFPSTLVYLTSHDLVTPKIQCLTVRWSETEGPIFYAIVESTGGGSVYLAEGKMNIGSGTGVITWNSIGVFAAKFQSIIATDAGFVVAIGDDGSNIYELKYHPVGIDLIINTHPSTNASNSNHDWKFAEVIKGKAGGESVRNTKTVTLLDGTETTWFYKSTDEAIFSTSDGVAVMLYAFPETGYEVTMTHNQLDGAPYNEVFQSFCFDYYQSCVCYGRDSNTEMIWYRSTTTTTTFETNFVGSSGKYGIRMMQMEWGLSAETVPVFVAMIGDEFNIGLCPTFDHHYYSTRGQKPGADAGAYLPDYVATEHYAVPTFGATWSYNPNRIREDNFRFYYRRAKAGSEAYEVITGNDLGTTEGMREAGILTFG